MVGHIHGSWFTIFNQILGICPGHKVPTSENNLLCSCPKGSIEAPDDKCIMCTVGEEVPNEDQTECVGMTDYGLK